MSLSKTATEQREKEVALLRRFMRLGVLGAIVFNLLVALVIGAFWHPPRPVAETEDEIEIVAEDQPTTAAPIAEADQDAGGGGGGAAQFSLFNPNPGRVASGQIVVPVASDPVLRSLVEPLFAPIQEPEIADPAPTPTPTPTPSVNPSPKASTAPAPSSVVDLKGQPDQNSQNNPSRTNGNSGQNKLGTSFGSGNGQGNGSGSGQGNGIGNGRGNGVGNGQGNGTGNGHGNGQQAKKPTESSPAKSSEAVAVRQAPPREDTDQPSAERKKPKCKDNCTLGEYLSAEGSARFDFDVDKDGNPINVRLRASSGNAEVDRKAEEAIRRRRYEASETGFQGQRIRVTSEQEGSDFQRQSHDRRREEAAQQAERDAQRAAEERREAERLQREAEQRKPSASAVEPIKPADPVPSAAPTPVESPPVAPTPVESPPPPPAPVESPPPAPVEPPPPAPVEPPPPAPVEPPPLVAPPAAAPSPASPAPTQP